MIVAVKAHRTQGNIYLHLLVYCNTKDITADEQPDEEVRKAGCVEGVQSSMPSPGVPHSQQLDVFTSLEALRTCSLRIVMKASSCRHD